MLRRRQRSEPGAIEGNRIRLYHDGADCLLAMHEAIAAARSEILLEMYWFGSDATGRRFAHALCEQAQRGLCVRVTYDAVGSWESDRAMFTQLRAAGVEVHAYNPLRPFRFSFRAGNRRDHRKLLVIDGRLGMTGGVNLADPWAPVSEGGSGFRDNLICIEGPAVAQMRTIFASTWPDPLPELAASAAVGQIAVRVLANDERKNRRRIETAYLRAIRRAKRRVLIENSYFIPGVRLRRALARAAARGVDVRILLPATSDVPGVSFATRRSYGWLLRRGVRLYEWGASVLHSKIAVVDDWCTVGTHNLDYRSWLYNLEINVSIEQPAIAEELCARIADALAVSVQIERKQWELRPFFQRWLEKLFYRFRRLL
jgi:cardiolipin synthase